MDKKEYWGFVHECVSKCTLKKHASNLTAALTKDSLSDERVAAYLKWCCVRYAEAVDENGRTLLHMAAAKGRVKLLRYLLKHRASKIHHVDIESRFSALHCSLFYGHIECAVQLIKAGADIDQLDGDELTPFDHIIVDKPINVRDVEAGSHDVYVWGINRNFVLGSGNQNVYDHPGPIETFTKQKIYFKKVILSKYHSAFLARDGRLWMCGEGDGGRLGIDKEAPVQTPKLVNLNTTNNECQAVALGIHHTIVLMGDKTVWSFGRNRFHQLGHDPPPEKVIVPKFIRGLRHVGIVGVSASKYHSAFWSDTRLYTCGLNAGQLGHTKDSGRTVIVPKPVSGLRQCGIKHVTCTYGATVLANSYGEIYLFYDYICRKITSRPFYPKLICALGGQLDYKVDPHSLQEDGGDELQVLVVTTCNSIYIWKEGDRKYLKYHLNFNHRFLNISDIAFNGSFVILTTKDGRAYYGDVVGRRTTGSELNSGSSDNYINLKRISYIHRAVMVSADILGANFAITQFQPKSRLYNFPRVTYTEADEHMRNLFQLLETTQYFQDVTFEVQGCTFSAHRFIVSHASPILENMMNSAIQEDGTCYVRIRDVSPQIFRAILCYIYTRDFNLISPYSNIPRFDYKPFKQGQGNRLNEVRLPFQANGTFYRHVKDRHMSGKEKTLYMKLLHKAAVVLGVSSLENEFDGGEVLFKRSRIFPSNLVRFDRERFLYLSDVKLKSTDGTVVRAHKCVLVSRLEYFNCMMNNNTWLESRRSSGVSLPMPGLVLKVLIHYLYTGLAPAILKTEDLELVFMTLVMADQVFCTGLKRICEYTLSNLMNLDNASDMFLVGLTFNATDLKRYASEFICQNLAYLLETRAFENLPDFVLAELSNYYRSRIPQMCMRQITAFSAAPEEELVDKICKIEYVNMDEYVEKPVVRSACPSPTKKKHVFITRRWRSLDSVIHEPQVEVFPHSMEPLIGELKKKDAPWIKVMHRFSNENENDQLEVEVAPRTSSEISEMTREVKNVRVKVFLQKSISLSSLRDVQCIDSLSDKDVPVIKRACSERTINSHSHSHGLKDAQTEALYEFSQCEWKRPRSYSVNGHDDSDSDPDSNESPVVSSCTSPDRFDDVYFEEDEFTFTSDDASSSSDSSFMHDEFEWRNTGGLSTNYQNFVVEDKQSQGRNSKSLALVEIEDKAIQELISFYNVDIVKGERITIRKVKNENAFRPFD